MPITLVVIATGQTCCFSRFLQLPSPCTATELGRAAAKISAGSVGSPYNQLYSVSCPLVLLQHNSEDIWYRITLWQSDMARYFTLRLYFHCLYFHCLII